MKYYYWTTLVLANIILFGFVTSNNAYCAQPMDWQFHNVRHSMVDRILSPQAQHGAHLAVLDTTNLDFQESYADTYGLSRRELVKLGLSNRYFHDSQPLSFLYQTFNAKNYKGKHIHVSAFAKSLEPDFEALEEWYEEQYSLWQESELIKLQSKTVVSGEYQQEKSKLTEDSEQRKTQALEEFAKFIRDSYEDSRFQLMLVLHRKSSIDDKVTLEAVGPTSSGTHNSTELWNRFNIEVGIPMDCYAISLVLESRGLNKIYLDHVALVEHGKLLRDARQGFVGLSPYFIERIQENFKTSESGFKNLSFER